MPNAWFVGRKVFVMAELATHTGCTVTAGARQLLCHVRVAKGALPVKRDRVGCATAEHRSAIVPAGSG